MIFIRSIILFLLILLLNGCVKELRANDGVINHMDSMYVEPELKPVVKDYLFTMMKNNIDVSRFKNIDSIYLVGYSTCICDDTDAIGCSNHRIIEIKKEPDYYDIDTKDIYLKVIMYHELGHSVLLLPHESFFYHIMFTSVDEDDIYEYEDNWDYYLKSYINFYHYCSDNNYLMPER